MKDLDKKCDFCANSRIIVSENGFHSICCLSDKKAVKCLFTESNFIDKRPIEGQKYLDIDNDTFYKYRDGKWIKQ